MDPLTKERPILFNGEMVRAILEGRKTVTRRPVKERLVFGQSLQEDRLRRARPIRRKGYEFIGTEDGEVEISMRSPFGVPGDRLWVRETAWLNGGYVATDPEPFKHDGKVPSIHMPRWASRITLLVKDVRVERLREITFEDCYAEGMRHHKWRPGSIGSDHSVRNVIFPETWTAIYGAQGLGWNETPWVWRGEFEVIEGGKV